MACSTATFFITLLWIHGPVYACVLDCTYVNMYDTMASKSVSTSTSMVPPDHLPPPPSTSAPINSPDPQPPNLSASLTETEQTPKRQTGAHDGTEPAAIGDILMEYSSD